MEGNGLMNSNQILIKSIRQINNYSFMIEWNDGRAGEYRLSQLQQNCPCANCVDEVTGKRINTKVDSTVKAIRITSVGRYAISIKFTSGCSSGIYGYDFLHSLMGEK